MTGCDKCERRGECYKEGRLLTYNSARDMQYDPMYDGRWGHGILNMGEVCPKWMKGAEDENQNYGD